MDENSGKEGTPKPLQLDGHKTKLCELGRVPKVITPFRENAPLASAMTTTVLLEIPIAGSTPCSTRGPATRTAG